MTAENDQTVEWYVENVLLGAGVSVDNITFNGTPASQVSAQVGLFISNGSYMPLDSGLVMSTGGVFDPGTGDIVGMGGIPISTTTTGGDADLQNLSNENINDQAIIEFDFIPSGDTLRFNYVFGSEEYPEYVNDFNDAFGFFISGPGIAGTYSSPAAFPDGSVNIALIPGTNTPVTIDNVNNGDTDCFAGGPSGPCTNCEFYQDNCDIADDALDGTTTVLEAFALVTCGETYHIKLAIGDALDGAFDSAVFLQAGSFQSPLAVTASLFSSISPDLDGTIYENCGFGSIEFSRQDGIDSESVVEMEISGVAQNGIDFTTIPSSFTFPAGDSTYVLEIYAITDGIIEGLETATVTITNTAQTACFSGTFSSEFTFAVNDNPDPLVASTTDHFIDCGEQVELVVLVSGGYGLYEFDWSNGSDEQTQFVGPGVTTDYVIVVSDTCNAGAQIDTSTVTVPVYPPLHVDLPEGGIYECVEVITIDTLSVSGGNGVYSYTWRDETEEFPESDPTLTYTTQETQYVTLIVEDGCFEQDSDQFFVQVPRFPIELLTSNDTVVCTGAPLRLGLQADGGQPPYTYRWSHFDLTQDTIQVIPNETTTYTVTVTDVCGTTVGDAIVAGVSEVQAIIGQESFGFFGIEVTDYSENYLGDTLYRVWDMGDGSSFTSESVQHVFSEFQDQVVTLNIVNEHGCSDSTFIEVTAPPTLFVPNSFSPNDDGINDVFVIKGDGIVDYELTIYDRSGARIFYSDDIDRPWTGAGNLNSSHYGANGDYIYHINARMRDGARQDFHGTITLFR